MTVAAVIFGSRRDFRLSPTHFIRVLESTSKNRITQGGSAVIVIFKTGSYCQQKKKKELSWRLEQSVRLAVEDFFFFLNIFFIYLLKDHNYRFL